MPFSYFVIHSNITVEHLEKNYDLIIRMFHIIVLIT